MDTNQLYNEAINKFGFKAQIDLAQEECGELIAALSHFKRGRAGSEKEVVEEIADVLIVANQLALIFGVQDVEAVMQQKHNRLVLVLQGDNNEQRPLAVPQEPQA